MSPPVTTPVRLSAADANTGAGAEAFARWKSAVEADLAKSGTPFGALTTRTPYGLTVEPLYSAGTVEASKYSDALRTTIGPRVEPLAACDHAAITEGFGTVTRTSSPPGAIALSTLNHGAKLGARDELALALYGLLAGGGTSIEVTVSTDMLAEIAKLRALRALWAWGRAKQGHPATPLFVRAVSRGADRAPRDPYTNLLRGTVEAFAALVGEADEVAVQAFDEGADPAADGGRLAANTTRLLLLESHLGVTVDPAAGSFAVEALTASLAESAWPQVQALSAAGGHATDAGQALVAQWKAEFATARSKALATRRQTLVGTTDFVAAFAKSTVPADATHDSAAYDALGGFARAFADKTGNPAIATVTLLADQATIQPRLAFTRGFFGACWFDVVESPLADVLAGPAPVVAVLCGDDASYAAAAADTAKALKAAGATLVLLAGKPGEAEASYRAAGIDGFAFLGADVPATGHALWQALSQRFGLA
jgi:hypothetical protein